MQDKLKIKLADKILDYIEELEGNDSELYEEDELFDEKPSAKIKITVKKKAK